jgi:hypothetical protein
LPSRPRSKGLQKKDWKEHKKICKSLNVGDGAMQVRIDMNAENAAEMEEGFSKNQSAVLTMT